MLIAILDLARSFVLVAFSTWVLGCLYPNVVLVDVAPRSLDSVGFKLGDLVRDFKLHFSDCFDLTSMSA